MTEAVHPSNHKGDGHPTPRRIWPPNRHSIEFGDEEPPGSKTSADNKPNGFKSKKNTRKAYQRDDL